MRLSCFALVFGFGLLAASAAAQTLPRTLPERVGMSSGHLAYADTAILRAIDAGDIPGAVLAVVKDGKMAYLKAYGYRSIRPKREKMTTNTIFDMASCSKPMSTAMCAMVLVDRGMLRLSDAVENFIPGFKNWISPDGKRETTIRVRHLLTHTSGLPPYAPVEELKAKYGSNNPDSLIAYIASWRRNFEPGTDFSYSCLNYITLQRIVEKISGMSLRDFARTNIFAPLGMNHTDYIPCLEDKNGKWITSSLPVWAHDGSWTSEVAPTQEQENTRQMLRGQVHDPLARVMNAGISGNAGVFSTADDIALLCAALINGGELNGRRILSPATVRIMQTVPKGLEQFGRTPGWDNSSDYSSNLGDLLSASAYGHTGFTGTMIDIDPENRLAVILLSNAVHPDGKGSMIRLRAVVTNAVAAAITGDSLTAHYLDRIQQFESESPITTKDIVMLGNSLTENGGDWNGLLGCKNVVNRGIIGDDVPGIYKRLHQILPCHPAGILLMEGINDISHGLTNAEIAHSIAVTVSRIKRESPQTKLALQSLLPINETFKRYKRLEGKTDSIPALNAMLKAIARENNVDFIDLFPLFCEKGSSTLRSELTGDGLHLNSLGYAIWSEALRKYLGKTTLQRK